MLRGGRLRSSTVLGSSVLGSWATVPKCECSLGREQRRARSLVVGRPVRHGLEPAQGAVSARGAYEAGSRPVLPGCGGRGTAGRGGTTQRARALSEWHRGRVLLSKTRAAVPAVMDRSGLTPFSIRSQCRGGGATRCRRARLDGQPRLSRAAPAPGARRGSRPSGRAARGPGPRAWGDVAPASRGLARRAGDATRFRSGRLAQDLGLARHSRVRPDRTSLEVDEVPGQPWRSRARSERQCARLWPQAHGGRKSDTACSSTTTRTPKTAPSPAHTPCVPRPIPRLAPLTWAEIETAEPGDFTLASMPARFAKVGDPHAGIDGQPCSLAGLIELSARHEREGLGDAPWPPQYKKQPDEPPRVQPSRRRVAKHPLIEIGRAQRKEDALAGLDRWQARHPDVAGHLAPADILVDSMRGRFRTWDRIRVNLQHVPVRAATANRNRSTRRGLKPRGWINETRGPPRRPSRARKPG